MTDDSISRQAAIELCDWYEHEFSECEYAIRALADDLKSLPAAAPEAHVIKLRTDIDKNEFLKAFEAAKKNLPTILPRETTGWIPVAEKEPEEYQKAICTNKHNEMMIGTYTSFGWIFPCYFETPIAWMPLPEPYKEEKE